MTSDDVLIRDIQRVEEPQNVQKQTLEVLNSLKSLLQATSAKKPIGFDTKSSSPKGPNISPISTSGPGDTLTSYFKEKFTGLISRITKPLENVMGLDLKRIAGGLRNIITNTSQSERELKKLNKQREKEKLAELKEEMRLGKKQLKSIGIKDFSKASLRDESGQSSKGMTDLEKIRALSHQHEGEINEKNKSRYARQIEALTGKSAATKSNFSVGGKSKSSAIGFDTTAIPENAKDSIAVSEKIAPTIKDLAKTASGQALIWYYNQTGQKKKGGSPEENAKGIEGIMNGLFGGAIAGMLPLIGSALSVALPILAALAAAGGVAWVISDVLKKAPEKKKEKERLDKIFTDQYKREHPNATKEEIQRALNENITKNRQLDLGFGGNIGGPNLFGANKSKPDINTINTKEIKVNASEKVEDAIITKTGKVIRTSPEDNILATKRMPSLSNIGFDKEIISALNDIYKKDSNFKSSEIVDAIKEQTAVIKEKGFNNVINNTLPNEFNFDTVRMAMSYNGVD